MQPGYGGLAVRADAAHRIFLGHRPVGVGDLLLAPYVVAPRYRSKAADAVSCKVRISRLVAGGVFGVLHRFRRDGRPLRVGCPHRVGVGAYLQLGAAQPYLAVALHPGIDIDRISPGGHCVGHDSPLPLPGLGRLDAGGDLGQARGPIVSP